MFNKLKQFNDLRKQANDLKAILAQESVEVENNAVKIIMNGNQEVQAIDIKKEYLSPDKKAELEKALKDGLAEAIKKIQRKMALVMQQNGGFDLSGLK